jgi:hypothetical protein
MDIAHKILCVGYFWPNIFKFCIEFIKQFPPCQIFHKKSHTHLAPLHPIVTIRPFAKWVIDFMQCNPISARGHGYIIVAIDYFTKWDKFMPTFLNYGHTEKLFIFNHIIA